MSAPLLIDLDTTARFDERLLASADANTRAVGVDRRGRIERDANGSIFTPLATRRAKAYLGKDAHGPIVLASALQGEDLRAIGLELSRAERQFAQVAITLSHWQEERYCVRCGTKMTLRNCGWVRRCEACGAERYPRTDPCIIVAVTDANDRLLLARAAHYPADRRSVLAGYVEPGEALEAAVVREVEEEVGLRVHDVTYVGSQPWPFPRSLMCAFTARVAGTPTPQHDGEEIVAADFYSRADIAAAAESGELTFPPGVSVARTLIERWRAA